MAAVGFCSSCGNGGCCVILTSRFFIRLDIRPEKSILYYSIEEPFGSIYIHVQKTEYRTDKHFDVKRGGGIIGKVELPGGKYRLLSVLGRGATSVVYLAEKTGSGKRYAVKVSICDREKLRREAFLLQKFSYPGIPCAVELLESGTKSFLVMEAVNGKSIGQRMRKGERFSSREILKTGIALSGILCYLHAQNPPVFYRDLKPDNVMITERGEIYLVDFGAAGTEETGVEVRYGTRGYAAPEQYDGKCDARSDLYALGALLAAMAKHAKKRQKRGLWRVMEKCMQKKPEERYASAGEVKKALRRLERKQKGRKTLRIFAVFAFLTGGAAAVASRMPWGAVSRRQTNGRSREISGSAEIRWKKAVCRTTRKRGKRS